MDFWIYGAYASIGVVSGVLAGLLGVGGGVIAVPALFFLFSHLEMPQTYTMHMAIATSLSAMILNTISSTWAHHGRQGVRWDIVKKSLLGLTLGGIAGAFVVDWISGVILEIAFGLFLCGIGFLFFREIKPHLNPHPLPKNPLLSLIFSAIGFVSILLGLSGGVFSVPLLTAFKLPAKQAIGTSAAMACSMTLVGTLAFFILGADNIEVPGAIGFVYLPAVVAVGIVSAIAAPWGVRLAHQMSDRLLRRVFGVALLLVGALMLW